MLTYLSQGIPLHLTTNFQLITKGQRNDGYSYSPSIRSSTTMPGVVVGGGGLYVMAAADRFARAAARV
jgi:hypothetical protein